MLLKPSFRVRLIYLLIAGPSIFSLNASAQPDCCVFNGYHVGGGLGMVNINSSISSNINNTGIIKTTSSDISGPGLKGNVFVGYSKVSYGWLYLGVEASVNLLSRREISVNKDNRSQYFLPATDTGVLGLPNTGFINRDISVTTNTSVSRNLLEPTLDIKPGVLITPNLLAYGRLGVGYNKITLNTQANFHESADQVADLVFFEFASANQAQFNQAFDDKKSSNTLSLRTGFGFTGMITPNFGISTDYIFSFYNTTHVKKASGSNRITCDFLEGCHVDNNGRYRDTTDARTSDQEILMQLIYYFNC